MDESYKWPICGKFNVTERAIRKARQFQREYGELSEMEYQLLLGDLISNIVNDPKNW